jgi:cyclase
MPPSYNKGLVAIGNGCYAYLQPDGGWGWSNAGLIAGDGASLLVDTLFTLSLTQEMLDAMAGVSASAPIATVVNTHANGDHCYGNQLVPYATIVASEATAHEMAEVPGSMMQSLNNAPGEIGELFRGFFGAFDFSGIETTLPSVTFSGRHDVLVGGRAVELHEVGPAHTSGDTIVHVPDASTVYTGDILFSHGTPIVWAGPLSNWVRACDRIIDLAPSVVVPGHGPLSTLADVRDCREYLIMVEREATARHEAGMTSDEAARDIALGEFSNWGERGRIAVNVDTVYRTLDPTYAGIDIFEMFRRMAKLEAAS